MTQGRFQGYYTYRSYAGIDRVAITIIESKYFQNFVSSGGYWIYFIVLNTNFDSCGGCWILDECLDER